MRKFDRAHIAQMLLRDSSLCGMSIRLVLFNIINLLFLLAGAGFFLLVSPKVFLAILALGLVALAIAYPLNLGTIRVTRSFEETSKLRPAEVRKVIDAALNATADDGRSDMPVRLDPEVEAKVAHGLIGNFLVVERFNFLLAMLFMLAVTAVLYYMTHNVETLVIEPQILVLLFVAFRYTYAGMHGLLIAVTMINRFLPSIVRVHSFLTLTEALKEPQKQLPARPGADPGEPLRFAWRVAGNGEETVERGVLRPGSVCLLAEALRYRADLLYRWFDVLTADQGRFATLYRPAVAAWAEASAKAEACTGDPSPWVAEVQAAVEPRWRPRTVSMLQAIDQLAATGAPMIVLDNPSMLLLSDTAIALVRARLAHALVLLAVPWNPYIRPSAAFDVLMVSNGSAIGFACPSSKLTPERLTAAEAFYNSRPEVRQAAEEEVDDVQGL
jgi:ABC-type multidrug transport system fused ATPase/permease subunit